MITVQVKQKLKEGDMEVISLGILNFLFILLPGEKVTFSPLLHSCELNISFVME